MSSQLKDRLVKLHVTFEFSNRLHFGVHPFALLLYSLIMPVAEVFPEQLPPPDCVGGWSGKSVAISLLK